MRVRSSTRCRIGAGFKKDRRAVCSLLYGCRNISCRDSHAMGITNAIPKVPLWPRPWLCYIVVAMKPARSFASDNNAGVHPAILRAVTAVNQDHAVGYGDDPCTRRTTRLFRQHFGAGSHAFFVFNGTAANVLSIAALTNPYHAVICGDAAHVDSDECGAPEKFSGCKLIPVPTVDGKLTVESVQRAYQGIGDQHHVQPRVISITQATEVGTVYKPREIKALARFAHRRGLFLHMDGARLANACASLGLSLRQATPDLGVDVLSFGGTKNGAMAAEAVVFFDAKLAHNFQFLRKQAMQLASKMRFISAQFEALLSGSLWLENAQHANRMAKLLQEEVRGIPQVRIVYKVETNGVFAQIPRAAIARLQKRYFFYVWNEEESVVRWMCSFDTTEEDVRQFARFVGDAVRG
jgi:threonine aldolase